MATTGFLLWRVTMKFRAAVDRALVRLGLTHAQYSLLASLYGVTRGGTGRGPSQRELADHTGLEPIFVSKLARALESAGLLTRDTHPADPRAVQLSLTERGTAVVSEAIGIVAGLHEEVLAPIGGVHSPRNRELAQTLKELLGAEPAASSKRSDAMTTPILTGQDIGEAEGAVRALLEDILDGTGHTTDEFIALRVLTLRPPMSLGELREFLVSQRQLRLDEAGADALLRGAAQAGLVEGTDPVRVTERGAAAAEEVFAAVRDTGGRVFLGLDETDLATTKRVLAQIVERAGAVRAELSS